jgi:exoribonuclease-2
VSQIEAVVLREATVRLDGLPLVVRVPSLPELPPGARVSVGVGDIDLLDKSLTCTFRETLDGPAAGEPVEDVREVP